MSSGLWHEAANQLRTDFNVNTKHNANTAASLAQEDLDHTGALSLPGCLQPPGKLTATHTLHLHVLGPLNKSNERLKLP